MSKDKNGKSGKKSSFRCSEWKQANLGSSLADAMQDLDSKFDQLDVHDHRRHRTNSKQNSKHQPAEPYKLKIVKFETTETIEGLGSLNEIDQQSRLDSNIKVVRKSRHSPEPRPRIKMIDDRDTLTNKLALGAIFDNWANIANFGIPAEAGDSNLGRESHEMAKPKKSMPGGDKISSSCESNKKIRKRSSFGKKLLMASTVANNYQPPYKDTIASKMRYEFRRNKKVCPYYIIQHVMRYQRPPFWNHAKIGKGVNGMLTRDQLQKICDI